MILSSDTQRYYMFDRRLIQNFDWGLFFIILMIGSIGLTTLYSAVMSGDQDHQQILYYKQMAWYGAGLTAMVISFLFDYRNLERCAYVLYGTCIILLVCVLFLGKYGGGSRRWLAMGHVSLQPSEVVKIAVIIVLSRYYSKVIRQRGFTLTELIKPAIFVMIPFALIVKQPDLGTAMVVFLIAASVTLFVKIERRSLMIIIFSCITAVPIVWHFLLKGYQRQRILTFLNPDRDPLGTGYHIIQSKIAIGSGMLFGKGMMKGTQNTLAFLPEQHTDFIFSVFAEERGFVGCILLILLFMILIIRGVNIAYKCRDAFGKILSVGVTAMIFWQTIINMGMVMGLMPVVGVPLPLVSYGGSSVITVMICVGILMNVSMRQFTGEH